MRIRLVLDVPPTDNKIYINNGFGGRTLSSDARKYKRSVKHAVARASVLCQSDEHFVANVEYEAFLHLYLERVENKGWAKGKTPNRYKRIDTTNRQKLVLDAVMEGIGIDDCHIFRVVMRKKCSQTEPRLVITIREREARRE